MQYSDIAALKDYEYKGSSLFCKPLFLCEIRPGKCLPAATCPQASKLRAQLPGSWFPSKKTPVQEKIGVSGFGVQQCNNFLVKNTICR
jgi:hypothetical protein